MDRTKETFAKVPDGLMETNSLASALSEKNSEQRPKYVQILKHEKNGTTSTTPSKSPAALGASSSSATESPISEKINQKNTSKKGGNKTKKNLAPPTNGKRPFTVFLKKQAVVPLPDDVEAREFQILANNVYFFSGPNNYLSALYPVKVVLDGNEYNSVEHYYQACKLYTLAGEKYAAELKSSASPIEVKKSTKNILKEAKIPVKKIAEWKDTDSIGVLKHVVLQKFLQNEDLKKKLLETGDKILIQTYVGDTYFAVGANVKYTTGWVTRHVNQSLKYPAEVRAEFVKFLPLIANGKNVLGWILMQVRDELRTQSSA